MVEEVLKWLAVGPGKRFVDGTAGGGGHTEAILEASAPDGKVLAIDRDPEAVKEVRGRLAPYSDRLTVRQANYGEAHRVLEQMGWEPVDGWLVDAGVSSHQLDAAERGFSLQQKGPLDMRMGPDARKVADFLDTVEIDELSTILRDYGEVKKSRRLARAIVEARRNGELETTRQLAELVEERRPRHRGRSSIHPATLVFQALRIAVNRELEHLEDAVERIPKVVKPGGRAVFISFHSLEDRIVKHGFRFLADPCVCPPDLPRCGCGAASFGQILTKGPLRPSKNESESNPRARSARMRVFELGEEGALPSGA